MPLLLFALLVLIIAGLLVCAVSAYAPIPQPFGNLICLLIVVIAVVAIGQRVGVF